MKKLLITLSLLLTFSFAATNVAAQVEGVPAPDLGDLDAAFEEIEGLQSIYDRTFSVDIEALMSDPEFDVANMDMSTMMNMIMIRGYTFDSEDNAKAFIEMTVSEMDKAIAEDESGLFEGMEVTELEGFDVDGIRVTMDMPDLGAGMSYIVFVDGNQVFQVSVMDAALDAANEKVDAVAQFVIDAEGSSDDVTLNADGTSTGGVFDRMPTADDEIVGDLSSVTDSELYAAE